jgi:hypothetical protein
MVSHNENKINRLKLKIMEYYVAQKVKESWGKKPCSHPKIEKEYYSGAFLINYVCTTCGEEFSISRKLEMDDEREKAG